MRKLAVIAALLGCVSIAGAQVRTERVVMSKYNLDSASYIYCVFAPDSKAGPGRIETSGSSATVTNVAGTTNAFTDVAVGDEITATAIGLSSPVTFTVVARASAVSITADRAINLDVDNGAVFTWKDLSCGTGAGDGWFTVPPGMNHLAVVYAQGDLTGGVDVSIENRYRGSYGGPLTVLTYTQAAVGSDEAALVEGATDWRVGLKYNTADPSDAGANIEQINVVLWNER